MKQYCVRVFERRPLHDTLDWYETFDTYDNAVSYTKHILSDGREMHKKFGSTVSGYITVWNILKNEHHLDYCESRPIYRF